MIKLNRQVVTLIIHRDGEPQSRSLRMPVWALRLGVGAAVTLGVAVSVVLVLYLPIVRTAAQVPNLRKEVAKLQADNARIRQLVAALDSAELRYAQIRQMMGADIVPDPVAQRTNLPVAPAVRARFPGTTSRYESGQSIPRHWPLEDAGYLTRGQVGTGSRDEAHPGIDIAVPTGSMVRAAGGGTVAQAGSDREYGLFVLLQHPDGYQTMYGHLSRIAVEPDQYVVAGEVIGLSGSSGRSSAPHLHFEVRLGGRSLDPLTLVKEGS